MATSNLTFDELHRTLLYADEQDGNVRYPFKTKDEIVGTPSNERVWRPIQKPGGPVNPPRSYVEFFRDARIARQMEQTEAPLPGQALQEAYVAYEFVAGDLRQMIARRLWNGQKFAPTATRWELKRSVLAFQGVTIGNAPVGAASGWFSPVVAPGLVQGHALVIGHWGVVSGGLLIVPRGSTGKSFLGDPAQTIAGGGKLFVAEGAEGAQPPDGWATVATGAAATYTVYTTRDGQVLRILNIQDRQALKDANWVIDYVIAPAVANVAVKLAYRGVEAGLALVGRYADGKLARTLLAGAAELLLERAAGNTVREVGLEAAMAARGLKFAGYERRTGVPRLHFEKMVEAARETNVVAVFRANKEAAIELIEKGAVGKPKALSIPGFTSSPETGVLRATTAQQIKLVTVNRYYLLEMQGGKPMMRLGSELKPLPREPYWKVEEGQVLNAEGHPVVGDYDGLGALALESPGRQLTVVPDNPIKGDWMGYDWRRYMESVNPKLDRPRVLHGAQDGFPDIKYGGKYGGLTDGLAYAVFPDGRVVYLNGKAEQTAFYEAFGRQTAIGAYPRPK